MAMTVMVELRVSSPRSEHLIHHIHAVDPRRLLVETNVCTLLAPRHRVHEGVRLAVSPSTQSLKIGEKVLKVVRFFPILEDFRIN